MQLIATSKMALRQKTEENYDILLRSLELSNELLGKLRRVPFIKEKIQFIKQQKTTDKKNDALLTALLEVPENLQESVLNDFIAALKSSGQEHVANIIRKDSDTMFMSDEHYRLLNSKQRQLCQFLEPRDGLIDHLVSDEVFTSSNGDSVLEGMVLVDDMVRQTVKILLRKSDDSFDKFINALNETEQDHVVHILTGIGIPPMSTEHRNLLQSKKKKLEMFLDPINGVLSGLTELNAVSRRDEARIRVMTSIDEMAQELVDTLMRKPDNVFEGLTKALNKAEQSHVTYILTGEGDSRPVSEECRAKLREKRSVVVESIYSQCLVSTLISKGVFSSHDQRRVESQLTDTGKSEMMVDLISRKSQAAFNGFIDTLKQCHHEHVAEELMNPEIIGKIHPQVSAEKEAVGTDLTEVKLCEAMQHAFENETEVKHLNDVLIPNGISVSKITYGSIIVKFRCRDHAAIVSLQNLYTSRQLDQLFTNTFCPQFAENGVEAIRINIAKEEIDRHLELNLMTSEHREALESSAKWLVDKILTIDDKLLGKLSLCKRRRQAIERAGTPEQQVKTLLDIVARQPDSAFTQLLNALNTTDQREAAAIINGGYKQTTTSESSECESTEIRITHTEGAWKEFGQNMTYLLRAIHTLPTDYSLLVRLALYGVIKSLHALCQQGLVPTLRWWIAEELESPLSMLGMSSTRLSLPEKLESPKLKWILDLCRRPGNFVFCRPVIP